MKRRKLFGRTIAQTAVRTQLVVMLAPGPDLATRVKQIAKPTHVQALLAQPSVEAFDIGVLDGLARPDVQQLDATLQSPSQSGQVSLSSLRFLVRC